MRHRLFSMTQNGLRQSFSTQQRISSRQPFSAQQSSNLYKKVNETTHNLLNKQTHYDPSKLISTVRNCISGPRTTWRNPLKHHVSSTQHYNLISAAPWWKTKQTHTFWPLIYQFNSGAFKYAWTTYRCTTDAFGNIDMSDPWTMLCFPSPRYPLPFKQFYNTRKVIQREFNLNRQLNQVHREFSPRPCLYHHRDENGNPLNTSLTLFPVRYGGPDLITVVNELELNPLESRAWFIHCYAELYRILKDLHINHHIRHGDIKLENVTLTKQPDNQLPPCFQYIDFGFSQPLLKKSQLGSYDDLPQTASLLAILLHRYKPGFSATEYTSMTEHLLDLKQAPAGATIEFWTRILTDSYSELPADLVQASHIALSAVSLKPQKTPDRVTIEEPYVDTALGIK